MRRKLFTAAVGVIALACAGRFAAGCSVPVFRYALEHWQPDAHVLHVFHRGGLTGEQQRLVDRLTPKNLDGRSIANVGVRSVDLDGSPDDAARGLWESHSGDVLPRLVLQKPAKGGAPAEDVWSGELTEENVSRLIDSPLRQTIARQLLAGESIVWVLLDSGHREQDDAAWGLLNDELQRLQQTLTLPSIDPADAAELTIPPESLKLSFASHRLSRDTAEERMLIEMLLSVESEMRSEPFVGQPMAFPIFGRGCALYTLVGEGINASTIEEACRFLTGGCQCTIKQMNPGVDLLLPVDWSLYVEPTVPLKTTLPPLVGLQGFGDDVEAGRSSPAADPVATQPAQAQTDGDPVVETTAPAETAPDAPQEVSTRTEPRSLQHTTRISLLAIVGVVLVGSVLFLAMSRR